MAFVSIRSIVEHWDHPALNEFTTADRRARLCLALLPDSFARSPYFTEFDPKCMSESTLRMVVSGNRKSPRCPHSLGCAGFTRELIRKLNEDPEQRQDLLAKLEVLVRTSVPELDAASPLFTCLPLTAEPGAALEHLQATRTRLLQEGTPRAVTWAVLLQVLAAWTQWKVAELPWLFDEGELQAYLAGDPVRLGRRASPAHKPLADPSYMGHYHAYLHRATRDGLFDRASVTIEQPKDGEAELRLELEYRKEPVKEPVKRCYRGIPLLSAGDGCVYAALTARNHALAFLCFSYESFYSGRVYFRTGLLITSAPRSHVPQVQKVVLTARELEPEELPFVRGVLAASGAVVTMTAEQLDAFCHTFRDASWMPEFEKTLLPFIRSHECRCYRFHQDELLSYSLSALSHEDRLRIIMALKSVPDPNHPAANRFLACDDPKDLHKLVK